MPRIAAWLGEGLPASLTIPNSLTRNEAPSLIQEVNRNLQRLKHTKRRVMPTTTFGVIVNYCLDHYEKVGCAPSRLMITHVFKNKEYGQLTDAGYDAVNKLLARAFKAYPYPETSSNFGRLLLEYLEVFKQEELHGVSQVIRAEQEKPLADQEPANKVIKAVKGRLVSLQEVDSPPIKTVIHNNPSFISRDRERYKNTQTSFPVFGIQPLDKILLGMRPGELILDYGSPGDGKSTLAEHVAFYNVYFRKLNVMFVSLEMPEEKVRDDISIMFANHLVTNPQLFPIEQPDLLRGQPMVDAGELDQKLLSPDMEHYYFDVARNIMAEDEDRSEYYGKLRVIAPNTSLDVLELATLVDQEYEKQPFDLLIVDYIALLDPVKDYRSTEWHTALASIIKEVKRYALRRNVPIFSPFQVNRTGRAEAEQKDSSTDQKKGYNLFVGSQSSESEKSADVVVAVFLDEELRGSGYLRFSVLKNRRGGLLKQHDVEFLPQYKYFALPEWDQWKDITALVEVDL